MLDTPIRTEVLHRLREIESRIAFLRWRLDVTGAHNTRLALQDQIRDLEASTAPLHAALALLEQEG